MSLHIWGRLSSINVRKVVLCAQVLGLDFERTDAGLQFGIVKTPEYMAKNPNSLVPLMDDDGFVLWESNVIVRFLCAKYSPDMMYPKDLTTRFDAERWMDWQQTTLNRAGGQAFIQWIRTPPEQRDHAKIAESVAATEPLLVLLNEHLASRAWMTGETMTMADIPIACEMHRWWGLPQARTAYPHLERWYAQMTALPASRGILDMPLS
jgi:glutathione S-transferase